MTRLSRENARMTGGFVDNASAFPTTPPAHHQQARRTFDLSYPADIFTRHRRRSTMHRLRWTMSNKSRFMASHPCCEAQLPGAVVRQSQPEDLELPGGNTSCCVSRTFAVPWRGHGPHHVIYRSQSPAGVAIGRPPVHHSSARPISPPCFLIASAMVLTATVTASARGMFHLAGPGHQVAKARGRIVN